MNKFGRPLGKEQTPSNFITCGLIVTEVMLFTTFADACTTDEERHAITNAHLEQSLLRRALKKQNLPLENHVAGLKQKQFILHTFNYQFETYKSALKSLTKGPLISLTKNVSNAYSEISEIGIFMYKLFNIYKYFYNYMGQDVFMLNKDNYFLHTAPFKCTFSVTEHLKPHKSS